MSKEILCHCNKNCQKSLFFFWFTYHFTVKIRESLHKGPTPFPDCFLSRIAITCSFLFWVVQLHQNQTPKKVTQRNTPFAHDGMAGLPEHVPCIGTDIPTNTIVGTEPSIVSGNTITYLMVLVAHNVKTKMTDGIGRTNHFLFLFFNFLDFLLLMSSYFFVVCS